MIKGILFDMDGVLIDAKDWHYEALNRALKLFGYEISRDEHLAHYDGLPTKMKLNLLTEKKGLPKSLHSFIEEMKQVYTWTLAEQKTSPNPFHIYALQKLKKEGYKIAICSNSIRKTIEIMTKKAEIYDYFDIIISNQDITKPKPDPEMYVTTMQKLELKPEECLICEDNMRGITSALKSGGYLFKVETVNDIRYEDIKKRIDEIENSGFETHKLNTMTRGWFVGNFFPTAYATDKCEVAIKEYKAGDYEKKHFHKIATEITVIIEGAAEMNGRIYTKGDIIIIKPNIASDFKALNKTTTACVKVPAANNDKFEC